MDDAQIEKAGRLLSLAIDFQKASSAHVRLGKLLEHINSEDRALIADALIQAAHSLETKP